jgi:TetR/AcrR family transcriptional repressor of nem operon
MAVESIGTEEQILDAAERRVQVVGFNGFSYADIAREVGITNASVHYYFPSKTDLGVRLVERYREHFFAAVASIEATSHTAPERLSAYVDLYQGVLAADRLCLCGIMASEYETLADPIKAQLVQFFQRNQAWLGEQLAEGRAANEFSFDGDPKALAIAIIGALEGSMLVARVLGGIESFRTSAKLILTSLCPTRAADAPEPAHGG